MNLALSLRDSIARRYALTVMAAVVVTWSLAGLVTAFGGVWAQPPLESSGLLEQAANTVRIIEAAPSTLRERLASAATIPDVLVGWYLETSPIATALDNLSDQTGQSQGSERLLAYQRAGTVERLLGHGRRLVILKPDGTNAALLSRPEFQRDVTSDPHAYILAVGYSDRSWLVFTAPEKLWGLNWGPRWAIWTLLLALSTVIVSTIATRRLVHPIKEFADGIRLFGTNPKAPPMAETGPRELVQVISAFNAMQAQIQNFVAHRVAMLAAISHDLRTPLTRMRLRGEFIEDQEQQARLFRDVDEMQAMVDGALALFRGDAIDEATTSFDLPGVLHTIINDYADQGVEITYAGPSRAVCRGRPLALKRAFTNLIENSVKYGTPPTVELTCGEKSSITIRDRGPGIPAEALERVFTPFYRLENSRNRETGGVGLGLTAALAIIREGGGNIVLRNIPAGGLEALVTLPRNL